MIRAKELGRKHAPYRQSRLTQVLEESLTGDRCHTTVIGCVSPAAPDSQQTLNTLRYAESLAGKKRTPKPSTRKAGSVTASPLIQNKETSSRKSLSAPRPAPPADARRKSAPMMVAPDTSSGSKARKSMPPTISGGSNTHMSKNGLFPKVSSPENKPAQSRLSAISALKDVLGDSDDEDDDELNLMAEFDDDELISSELDDLLEECGLEEYHDMLSNAMNDGNTLAELKALGLNGVIDVGVPKIKAMKLWRAVMLS